MTFCFSLNLMFSEYFPCSSVGKDFACSAGDPGSIPGLGRSPGEGNGQPTPVSLPGKSHGQKSLVGCSPWGCKESGTTERLTLTYSIYIKILFLFISCLRYSVRSSLIS